uniref:Uncharacterized protein n=1 Tax=Nothobranchius furzeri TaxID=105023 RepID=A0A8C6M6V9_NOTFU
QSSLPLHRNLHLFSFQIQHSNITKEEQSAMTALSKNEQIIILPADKGRTTVVMDREKYKQQMKQMLEDKNTYEILKKDPTENIKKNMKKLLKPLHEKGKITEKMYKHWIPTANITPRIYGTPKIHKQNTPLRPIVDSIASNAVQRPGVQLPRTAVSPQHESNCLSP